MCLKSQLEKSIITTMITAAATAAPTNNAATRLCLPIVPAMHIMVHADLGCPVLSGSGALSFHGGIWGGGG